MGQLERAGFLVLEVGCLTLSAENLVPQVVRDDFPSHLQTFASSFNAYVATKDGQWTIKGFIDIFRHVYPLSPDTKLVSKILEIHLLPAILAFANAHGYLVVSAEHQNYYPDFSFVSKSDPTIKFAVDIKTTYRLPGNSELCNGFTFGSHGEYFTNRHSAKNIQFPYNSYAAHYCLGVIYSRAEFASSGVKTGEGGAIESPQTHTLAQLASINSVIGHFQFFAAEKWRIASDKSGSGNTAHIGSIKKIGDILLGRGIFSRLGETWFDDYWMNDGKITISDRQTGKPKKIRNLREFVIYRNGDLDLIVPTSR